MVDWKERVMRTVFQLMVAGVLTGLVNQLILDLPPSWAPYIALAFAAVVTLVQNYAERAGWVRPMLKHYDDPLRSHPLEGDSAS